MKMTLSYEWLCSLVENLDQKSPEAVGLALTAVGAECEEVEILSPNPNIKLAKILTITPLKEKLSHIELEIEGKKYNSVSNSPALKINNFVLFAPNGSDLYDGTHVQAKNFDNVVTDGLLLALQNIGIEAKSNDIAHLGSDKKFAQELHHVFTQQLDAVYTLDVPGNRPDWLSVRGLARALSIYFDLNFIEISQNYVRSDEKALDIRVTSDRCNSFSLTTINNITQQVTSALFQKRLYLLGMRPISYFVDLSNLIMLETGQPSHAFDAKKVKGSIIIRQAEENEKMTLLDGSEITLSCDDLLVCDEEKILALAGIMGSLDSGVTSETTSVYFEVASFNGTWIRRSAKRLGLKTESSLRFEKHTSPDLVPTAQEYFCTLIQKQNPSTQISEKNYVQTRIIPTHQITVSCDEIRSYLGTTDINDNFIINTIKKIGCECTNKNGELNITSSKERLDLKIKEDIVEEIARFYGYDKIPSHSYRPSSVQLNPEKSFLEKIRPLLRGMGFNEAVTVPFRSSEQKSFYQIPEIQVTIQNPLNSEWTELRTHLFDGLIEVLKINISKAFEKNIAFSEIASVFEKDGGNFVETQKCAFIISNENDPYDKALNLLRNILAYSKVSTSSAQAINPTLYPYLHPKNSFEIIVGGECLGFFGEIHPTLLKKLDLSDKKEFPSPIICEMKFEVLKKFAEIKNTIKEVNTQPPVFRDITLSVSENSIGLEIAQKLKNLREDLKAVDFISIFQNDRLKELGLKNLSLRLRFESNTLVAEEIDSFIKNILKSSF